MALHTYGAMGVDWEERVRFDRLREERLARIKAQLENSDMGALLCFDMTNIRYVTATHIGTWAQDKLNRFCLLAQNDEPIMWDFGSAARHHAIRRGAAHRPGGAEQPHPFLPPPPKRRADHVGLRLRRPPPRDLLPVAG